MSVLIGETKADRVLRYAHTLEIFRKKIMTMRETKGVPLDLILDYERWYPLMEHPVQEALITDNVRFAVVPGGRRSGKTERAKRRVAKAAMSKRGDYFIAAPTHNQVKKIYWEDMKRLCFSSTFKKRPSESSLMIRLPNGSSITLIGLDVPQRMEGVYWTGGVIDEIADIKSGAWETNIAPALDTYNPYDPTHRAWCWLIGVPDGLNHYYDMAERARHGQDPDWKLYTWLSSDILPDDMIESAKRRMSKQQFRQEYEASFETASGRIYADYSPKNVTSFEIIGDEDELWWYHDFNYTPMSSGIGVLKNNSIYLLDEIILTSATARQAALEFVDRYAGQKNKKVRIYGDPAGRAGEKHGQASNYTEMEQVLRDKGWTVDRRVKKSAPAIRDRQNAVRAKICNALGDVSLFVNPSKAPYTHKGLSTVLFKEGSAFLEEESDYQHITTAIGYMVDYEYPVTNKREVDVVPLKSKNFY